MQARLVPEPCQSERISLHHLTNCNPHCNSFSIAWLMLPKLACCTACCAKAGYTDVATQVISHVWCVQYCRHAIKKGFDHLPSYIAAKLAGYKKAKQQKRRRGGSRAGTPNRASRGGSPSRGSNTPRGIQMTSRVPGAPEDRYVAQHICPLTHQPYILLTICA